MSLESTRFVCDLVHAMSRLPPGKSPHFQREHFRTTRLYPRYLLLFFLHFCSDSQIRCKHLVYKSWRETFSMIPMRSRNICERNMRNPACNVTLSETKGRSTKAPWKIREEKGEHRESVRVRTSWCRGRHDDGYRFPRSLQPPVSALLYSSFSCRTLFFLFFLFLVFFSSLCIAFYSNLVRYLATNSSFLF